MANWYGTARSNYFRVRNPEAFKDWVRSLPELGFWEFDDQPQLFGIYSNCPDSGGWPTWRTGDDGEDEGEIDIASELAEHLAEGEVAVLIEAGAEKLRYISGQAIAINHMGEVIDVTLSDIYGKAFEKWGIHPTEACY